MRRLTEKDYLGNWCLKGVKWEQLHIGQVITEKVSEKLYGALCKLRNYEDTNVSPEEVEQINDFTQSQAYKLMADLQKERNKHRWIPVTERLPKSCGYIVLSFAGLEEPAIGMYEENEWYLGDVYGSTTCCSVGLTVSAWMPLPEPYKE